MEPGLLQITTNKLPLCRRSVNNAANKSGSRVPPRPEFNDGHGDEAESG